MHRLYRLFAIDLYQGTNGTEMFYDCFIFYFKFLKTLAYHGTIVIRPLLFARAARKKSLPCLFLAYAQMYGPVWARKPLRHLLKQSRFGSGTTGALKNYFILRLQSKEYFLKGKRCEPVREEFAALHGAF